MILVTYPDETATRTISRSSVERRLVVCFNIFTIGSMYRWDGDNMEDSEFASLLKIRTEDF